MVHTCFQICLIFVRICFCTFGCYCFRAANHLLKSSQKVDKWHATPKHSIPTPTALLISVPCPSFFSRPVHPLPSNGKNAIPEPNKCDPPSFLTSRNCHISSYIIIYRHIISIFGEGWVTNFSPHSPPLSPDALSGSLECRRWRSAWNRMRSTLVGRNGSTKNRKRMKLWCNVVQCGAMWCNVVQCGAIMCITEMKAVKIGQDWSTSRVVLWRSPDGLLGTLDWLHRQFSWALGLPIMAATILWTDAYPSPFGLQNPSHCALLVLQWQIWIWGTKNLTLS